MPPAAAPLPWELGLAQCPGGEQPGSSLGRPAGPCCLPDTSPSTVPLTSLPPAPAPRVTQCPSRPGFVLLPTGTQTSQSRQSFGACCAWVLPVADGACGWMAPGGSGEWRACQVLFLERTRPQLVL